MQIKSPKDLIVYQKAYALAMKIFEVSKSFPAECCDKSLITHRSSVLCPPSSNV
jgi:23S rRNA-intervening sequence protein